MKLFKEMRASTKVLLAILLITVLIGAGFFIWAQKTGKLASSADTAVGYGRIMGKAYIYGPDGKEIPVTNVPITITPGSGRNTSSTFYTY